MKTKKTFRLLYMKKTITLTLLFLLFLMYIPIGNGSFDVQPRELSLTMGSEFIRGNTSRNIIILNNNDYDINVSWYLDHPDPISWMRPNKTLIPHLSWIDIKPHWQIIPPYSKDAFYIYFDIPEKEEYLNQHWETWITFKTKEQQYINIENAVRLYIDTPIELITSNDQNDDSLSIAIGDQIKIPLFHVALAAAIIALLVISIIVIKKKKS